MTVTIMDIMSNRVVSLQSRWRILLPILVIVAVVYSVCYYVTQDYFEIKIIRKGSGYNLDDRHKYATNAVEYTFPTVANESEYLRKNCSEYKTVPWSIHTNMIQRTKQLCDRCHVFKNIRDNMETAEFRFKARRTVLYFPKFDLAYCKVPKAGCTFLSQMFHILQSENTNETRLFGMARNKVHGSLLNQNKRGISDGFPTIIASRDPFSRLFSGFIDKIFLPLMQIKRTLVDKGINDTQLPQCGGTVSFEQFLKFVIYSAKQEYTLDQHWTPISSMCKPCRLNTYMIIKQESYSDDIETFLKSLNVSSTTYQKIKDAMTSKRIEATLPGIIETTIVRYRQKPFVQKCLKEIDVIELLWKSFQIQGFFSSDLRFPKKQYNNTKLSNDLASVKQMFVNAARSSNLSNSESLSQRRKYLVEAYKGVSSDTITDIVKLFKADFLLFDYDMTPPY